MTADEVQLPPPLDAVVKKVVDELRPDVADGHHVTDMVFLAARKGEMHHKYLVLRMFAMYPEVMTNCCLDVRGDILIDLIKISSDIGVVFDMAPMLGDSLHLELCNDNFTIRDCHMDHLANVRYLVNEELVHKYVQTLQAYPDKLTADVEGVPIIVGSPGLAERLIRYLTMNASR
jgi:hypothetical protein